MDPRFCPQAFVYASAGNTYTCPAGKELQAQGIKKDRVGVWLHFYQAAASDCQGCAFRVQGSPGAKQRTTVRTDKVPVVAA
jgi:hypothetical protein